MDDLSIGDGRLERALRELRGVNRYLGGYHALHRAMAPLLAARTGAKLSVLDVGSGLGDHAVALFESGRRFDVQLDVHCLDANPSAAVYGRAFVDSRLSPAERKRIQFVRGDAVDIPYQNDAFDVVTASLLLHHFDDAAAVPLLREMARVAACGIVINDLHRHPLAYLGIRSIAILLPVSAMFAHDGPVSVRRAFRPEELLALGRQAGLTNPIVRRHWPFRLTLAALPPEARL